MEETNNAANITPETPENGLLSKVFDFAFLPMRSTVFQIKRYRASLVSILVFFLSILSFTTGTSVAFSETWQKSSVSMALLNFTLSSAALLLSTAILSGWVNFISNYMGIFVSVKDTVKLLLLSFFPLVFALPAGNILLLLSPGNSPSFYMLFTLLLFLVVIVNSFICVRENYGFSLSQVLLIFIVPVILVQLSMVFIAGIGIFYLYLLFF